MKVMVNFQLGKLPVKDVLHNRQQDNQQVKKLEENNSEQWLKEFILPRWKPKELDFNAGQLRKLAHGTLPFVFYDQ